MTATDVRPMSAAPATVTPPGHLARPSAWLALAALAAALLTLPGGLLSGGASARLASGEVDVLRGERWEPLDRGAAVVDGDELRVRGEGARLEMVAGGVRLTAGAALHVGDEVLRIDRGSVLAEGLRSWRVALGVAEVAGSGTWRVDADGAPRIGVYAGEAVATDSDTELGVGPLEQLELATGVVVGEPHPLRYLASDPWDREQLSEAIAVDRFVSQLSTTLELRYGTAPQSRAFYRDFVVVDGSTADALGQLAPRREGARLGPPAGVLVGALVVDQVAGHTELTRATAAERVVGLRRDGAGWGLIAMRHELTAEDIRGAVDAALGRRERAEAQGSATPLVPDADAGGDDAGAGDEPNGEPGQSEPAPPSDDDADPSGEGGDGDGDESDGGGGGGNGGGGGDGGEDPGALDGVSDTVEDVGDLLPEPGEDLADETADAIDDVDDAAGELLGDDDTSDTQDADGGLLDDGDDGSLLD